VVSADVLGQVTGAELHARVTRAVGRLVIAAGGTAVRGARNREQKALHRAAAVAQGIGAVPGQVAADAGSDEVPTIRDRLTAFTDLAGAVITADALHA